MNKGFSIIEMIICSLLLSVCALSTITLYINFKKQLNMQNDLSINFEHLKQVEKFINNKFLNSNVNVEIMNNSLIIDDIKFMDFENQVLRIYQDNIVIYNIKIDNFELNVINDHLFKIEIFNKGSYLEKYYYIGGEVIEN